MSSKRDRLNSVPLRTPDARVSALGIAREVARAIELGAYAPGDRLREQQLADHFSCSRAPVREALRILESQGMIVIEPMKGARIAFIEEDAFHEVFQIRRALAGLMAQRAALGPADGAKAALITTARGLEPIAPTANAAAFGAAVRKTIRALIDAANAPRTVQIVRGLTFGHEAFQGAIFEAAEERIKAGALWSALAQAVEQARDADARTAIEGLFDHSYAFVLKSEDRAAQPAMRQAAKRGSQQKP